MMTAEDRVKTVAEFGFTERQARFLVMVMRHAGICVPRQYAASSQGVEETAAIGEPDAYFERVHMLIVQPRPSRRAGPLVHRHEPVLQTTGCA
jgi:hypothetical protein